MTTPLTITLVALNDCNFNCSGCIAGCNLPSADKKTRLSFDASIKWLAKFAPGCNVHVSGGEPFLHEELVGGIKSLIEAGHNVTLFSNGSLLSENFPLLDLPIIWHLTHHPTEQTLNGFLQKAALVKNKLHLVCRVYDVETVPDMDAAASDYAGYNFKWIRRNCGYVLPEFRADMNDAGCMRMVGIHGEVYPCGSGKQDTIGNVYDMTYDADAARRFESKTRSCIQSGVCGSYHSAFLCNELRPQHG